MNVYASAYPEIQAGGFTRLDGTIQFFQRVQAVLIGSEAVLDFGAGRGAAIEGASPIRRNLTDLRAPGRTVVGIDVDEAILENARLDEAIISTDGRIPLEDHSIDVIVADHVLEHIQDIDLVAQEFDRVLRPGGWVCARTPYLFSLLALCSTLIPNSAHTRVLRNAQPNGRPDRDVFPTRYKMNTNSVLKRLFPPPKWSHHSYTWSPEPAYHFGKPSLVWALTMYQYLKKPFGGEVLMVFIRKNKFRASNIPSPT